MNLSASATVPLPGSTADLPGALVEVFVQEGCNVMAVKTSMIDPIVKRVRRGRTILIPYLRKLSSRELAMILTPMGSRLPEAVNVVLAISPSRNQDVCVDEALR